MCVNVFETGTLGLPLSLIMKNLCRCDTEGDHHKYLFHRIAILWSNNDAKMAEAAQKSGSK